MTLGAGVADPPASFQHVRSAIRLSVDVATTLRDVYDVDVVAAGAALHDVCKVVDDAASGPGPARNPRSITRSTGVGPVMEEGMPPEVVHVTPY